MSTTTETAPGSTDLPAEATAVYRLWVPTEAVQRRAKWVKVWVDAVAAFGCEPVGAPSLTVVERGRSGRDTYLTGYVRPCEGLVQSGADTTR